MKILLDYTKAQPRENVLHQSIYTTKIQTVAIYASTILLLILPILLTSYLPLLDVASHESRILELKNILFTKQGSQFYGLDTMLLPNVGFDLPGLVMATWMKPEMVGRWFFGASIMMTLSGVVILGRVASGRWSTIRIAVALLLYNLFTLLGFLSYGMGVALMLWALAVRLLLHRCAVYIRFPIGCILGIILLFCHVSAFAVYAVMMAGFGLEMLICNRRNLLHVIAMGAEMLPAMILFVFMSTGGQGRMHYDLPFWRTKIFAAAKTVSCGSEVGDIAFVVGALAVAVLLLACGKTRLRRPFVPGLIMLTILYFVLPPHVSGGSYVDSRVPVVIVLLAFAAVDFDLRAYRLALPLMIIAAGAFATKQGAVAAMWYQNGHALTRLVQVFAALPDGAVLLQAECVSDDIAGVYTSRQPPLTHVAAMATFTGRRFAAISWTLKGQQPVYTLPAYAPYKTFQDQIGPIVCTASEYRTILQGARTVALAQSKAGAIISPLYLLLLRPPVAASLRDIAPLLAQTQELEIYDLN